MEIARQAGFTVLDTSSAYDGIHDWEALWIAKWDRHPGARGHRILAGKIYDCLKATLGQLSARSEDRPN